MSDAEVYEVYKAIKLAKGSGRGAKEAFAEIKPIFFAACKASGIKKETREEIWHEVVGDHRGTDSTRVMRLATASWLYSCGVPQSEPSGRVFHGAS
jgi:hypothetical protein